MLVFALNLRDYNHKQIVLAGIMEAQGMVKNLDDYIKRFSPRFRVCYFAHNGRVTVNDLIGG